VLTFFGFMHGEAIGFAVSPVMALSYLGVAATCFACARLGDVVPAAAETPAPEVGHAVAVAGGE
jgi:AGZA family xanthine/uracil permease-like MFS transporter